ncbi:nuclear transport factor 2-like protein [Streptomyces cellulosae]|uniref:SnoaL-like domain-containing protein n=1 Tax=Streptomyces cellulosae TaxID=1968 RepID=A0ABW7XSS5_STRCE
MSTNTAPASTRDVVDAFSARFGEGDMPALLDLFADGVAFHVGGAP